MHERILRIRKSTRKHKKYVAIILANGKIRTVHFGDSRYPQYRDQTKIKAFSHKDHGDKKRRQRYFMRHSGVKTKTEALKQEIMKSHKYTAKRLSHMYLW